MFDGVRRFAAQLGADVLLTERPRHARDLTTTALNDGCELIVAVGGDGTMNEVGSALIGTPATLGLIPCGSGDGLGRFLGLHGSLAHSLEILRSGRPRPIDTGVADGHPFINLAGLGFEAELGARFNRLERRGFLRYLSTGARTLRACHSQRCTITADDAQVNVDAFTLAVANSAQYGNNALIAPHARVDDGQLDLCALPTATWFNVLPLTLRLFSGTIDRASGVVHRRGTRFVIERPAPGPIHTDGEIHEAGRTVEFMIRPASLRIMCPVV